jgi:hypothetical protein
MCLALDERINESVDRVNVGNHIDTQTSASSRVGGDRTNAGHETRDCVDSESRNPIVNRRRRCEGDNVRVEDTLAISLARDNRNCSIRIDDVDTPTQLA